MCDGLESSKSVRATFSFSVGCQPCDCQVRITVQNAAGERKSGNSLDEEAVNSQYVVCFLSADLFQFRIYSKPSGLLTNFNVVILKTR